MDGRGRGSACSPVHMCVLVFVRACDGHTHTHLSCTTEAGGADVKGLLGD